MRKTFGLCAILGVVAAIALAALSLLNIDITPKAETPAVGFTSANSSH